eukprot:TRINITY_DN10075_c0_g1_i1.p2 TRINITY_DN10075_c0_g1~~TRINITY_DN10075_c0_g1_i1.p2  ORF type:complete len:291 (+),score=26.61 TRINITY_DN10075_c0_g1_i1:79-951(+)
MASFQCGGQISWRGQQHVPNCLPTTKSLNFSTTYRRIAKQIRYKQKIVAVGVESVSQTTKNEASSKKIRRIAFFDVDGTIAKTNIVWPFVYIQFACLSILSKMWWIPFFAIMTFVYRAVDKFDRTTFNKMFYWNYKGYSRQQQPLMASIAMEKYYKQRIFAGVGSHIEDLRKQGYWIVLVTGQLDFIAQELAKTIGANDVIAAQLQTDDKGIFTGQLQGPPVSDGQKQVLMNEYAGQHDTDMQSCIAYGDSISDLPMLMSVGTPITVAPDAKLREIAVKNDWKIIEEWEQ